MNVWYLRQILWYHTLFIYLFYFIHIFQSSHWSLSGEPDYFGRNKISSGGDLSHYSSASLY